MNDVAITVYVDNNEKQFTELSWLYRSWLYSGSALMSDIVIFHNPKILEGKLPVDDHIVYVPLVPLSEVEDEWSYYPHINSTWYLTTKEAEFVKRYKYILRTDNDCFLTPNFPSLRPRLATFGSSVYASNPEVIRNLTRISQRLGVKQHFINNHNTIMAFSKDVLKYSAEQFRFCKILKNNDFPDGVGEWPGWYLRVLNMYTGQLAANSVFGINMVIGGLDVYSMSQDPICSTDFHIHAWHTYIYFSKLSWAMGEYEDMDFSKLDRKKIADYCMWIVGKRGEV